MNALERETPEDFVSIGLRLFQRIQFVVQLCSDSIQIYRSLLSWVIKMIKMDFL